MDKVCLYCSGSFEITRKRRKVNIFCSPQCSQNQRVQDSITKWLNGETTGLSSLGTVSKAVKRWLRETRGNACELCGWAEVNPVTQSVPVVADHIDGNWQNNRPENLRLLCPNCDSLQPTYKALNKGNGRSNRKPV